MKATKALINASVDAMHDSEIARDYFDRHGVESAAMLTVHDDETADAIARYLAPRIAGKTVIEIGGGIGLLALHLGFHAKRVYCIEANPAWSWAFVGCLFAGKPKNVSYLFGAADEFSGVIKADVALFCTHSGLDSLRTAAEQFAPEVIDVYGEIIAGNPEKFDKLARMLRPIV